MKQLQDWLAAMVRERVLEAQSGGSPETRLIFHGPPLGLLQGVFDRLVDGKGALSLPVLLQVPALPSGASNPASGASGICDEGHLLNLRNSPRASSYLALVPPGQHAIRSVTSTTDEFGMLAARNGANVDFDDWWADPFLQSAIDQALSMSKLDGAQLDDARQIVTRAARSFDDVAMEPGRREPAWQLIARIFEAVSDLENAAALLSLACGMPATSSGRLAAGQQVAILEGIASALSDGFSTGLDSARDAATDSQRVWIDAFLDHIRTTCSILTALERSPEAFYAPSAGWRLAEPPEWWSGLTADVWAELLDDEPEIIGDIRIECANPLLPSSRGVPLLVEGPVVLSVSVAGPGDAPVSVTLERSPSRSIGGFPMDLPVEGSVTVEDEGPPAHKSPIQYKALADGFRTASVKVVSLASWAPGVFISCRQARKVTPPKKPSRTTRGTNWEAALTLPGPGRYELLVFLSPGSSLLGNATGLAGGDSSTEESVAITPREVQAGLQQLEVEVDGSYQIDLPFLRVAHDGRSFDESCRIFLSCDDVVEGGCSSEFERLIMVNRRQVEPSGAKPVVQLNRNVRISTLQGWMLQPDVDFR